MATYKEKDSDPNLGYVTKKETQVKVARATRVKNKTPAPVQITAEQILREAGEKQQSEIRPPKQHIKDSTELADYLLRKRKQFEDVIRRDRSNVSVWVKYAQFEEAHKDFCRTRSIWERALAADDRNPILYLKYAEMEMKNKFLNHARNIWNRAVTYLPRVDQLWYKWIHMEVMLGNVAGARQIFERWMDWKPDQEGWLSYNKFELKYKEINRARGIYERFVECHPSVETWIRYAEFEEKLGEVAFARSCYERASAMFGDDDNDEEAGLFFLSFAEFEERFKEIERARSIYKFALDRLPKSRTEEVYKKFLAFEKRYGDKEEIEDVIVRQKRFDYEDLVRKSPLDYNSWFDYIRLEKSVGSKEKIREVYRRAIANVPLAKEKRYWQRYIYLWINYALYEELDAEDMDEAREVYRECLNLIPHKKFTFAKVWMLASQFEIRQLNLKDARLILGRAIGDAVPKEKIFKKYIELEMQLGNIDRCRKLYEKYVEAFPVNCRVWMKFVDLERSLGEIERVRCIFELATAQPVLDLPEVLWKAYIDFETEEGELERAKQLYERLLDRTKHLKVWVSYARFEASAVEQKKSCVENVRAVFERALDYFTNSSPELKEERAMVLEEWLKIEEGFGDAGDMNMVLSKTPKKLKRKRLVVAEEGIPAGSEEYIDYIFPEEEQLPSYKILHKALEWKRGAS